MARGCVDHFELRRQSDDLVYRFERAARPDGLPGYLRQDEPHWIVWKQPIGWVAWDDPTQSVMGRPWDVSPADQSPEGPPEGIWLSRKGPKSYVYALVHCDKTRTPQP